MTSNISFSVTKSWNGGFTGEIIITNNSLSDWNDWLLELAPNFEIVSIWNGEIADFSNNIYSLSSASWNSTISAGNSITIGFKAKGNLNDNNTLDSINYTFNAIDSNFNQISLTNIEISLVTDPNPVTTDEPISLLWSDDFSDLNWQNNWQLLNKGQWGEENLEVINPPLNDDLFDTYLRTYYPAGSVTPSYSKKTGEPIGGAQFFGDLGIPSSDTLKLSYYLRFSDNFDFVKGGKLPGLYGGTGNTGGNIPDGTDGFSTRFMWRTNGDAEVYAYLPTSTNYGTSLGRGDWQFVPGVWHHLEQEVYLNDVGQNNGAIEVSLDGVQVANFSGLNFRSVDSLNIDGVLFSTFFGGSDSSWATPNNTYVDFANFNVSIPV